MASASLCEPTIDSGPLPIGYWALPMVSGHCQGTGGISIRLKSFWILGLLQIRTSMNSRLAQLSVSQRGLKGLSGKTFFISIHNIFIHLE